VPDRDAITARLHETLLDAGRVDLPLRTLGKKVGVSARMLMYYYGSREQLVLAVLAHERTLQQRDLSELGTTDPVEMLRAYFRWMTDASRLSRVRFFFDLVADAGRNPEQYGSFLRESLVGYWQEMMTRALRVADYADVPWDIPSLALATARGLYLELIAGADPAALRRRYDLFLAAMRPQFDNYASPDSNTPTP